MRSLTEPVKETLKVMEEPLKEACKRGQAELLGSHDRPGSSHCQKEGAENCVRGVQGLGLRVPGVLFIVIGRSRSGH